MSAVLKADDQSIISHALCQAADLMGLKRQQLAMVIGVSEPTMSRIRNETSVVPQGKPLELALLFLRAYRALYAIIGGDPAAMQHWLKTPNSHLADQAPIELLQKVEGITQVVRYLDAMRGRV